MLWQTSCSRNNLCIFAAANRTLMEIRNVNPMKDSAAIVGIYNPFITDTVVTFETAPLSAEEMGTRIESIASTHPYIVCEIDGELAGYAYVHTWRERSAFFKTAETSIYISPMFRHKGIGKALMSELIKECRGRELKTLIAMIDGENETSFRFHESLGFKRVGHYHNVGYKFGRYLDLVSYQLELK